MAEMASGQRGFDALLLGEEPIEGVVEFLPRRTIPVKRSY
jgi:hypothetical protein